MYLLTVSLVTVKAHNERIRQVCFLGGHELARKCVATTDRRPSRAHFLGRLGLERYFVACLGIGSVGKDFVRNPGLLVDLFIITIIGLVLVLRRADIDFLWSADFLRLSFFRGVQIADGDSF